MCTAGTNACCANSAPAAAAADCVHHHHQQHGVDSLVNGMKSAIRREMDQLNKRIDQIDKQVSMILQLLSVNSAQAPREPVERHDNASADKKMPARAGAVQSPTFMDTITEQDEDSSLTATDDAGDGNKQRQTSDSEQDGAAQQPQYSSAGQASESAINDKHRIIQQDLDIL